MHALLYFQCSCISHILTCIYIVIDSCGGGTFVMD